MTEYTTDDLLNDSFNPEPAEEAPSAEPQEAVTGEVETEQAAAETAAAEPAEAADDVTPASESKEPEPEESWTKKAVLDERRKRQELQAQLDALQQQQTQPQQPEKPDWYDDPDKAAQAQAQTFEQRLTQQKFELTQDMMKSAHPDYDEMESRFVDLARENPQLIVQMQQSANPARFAYDTAKKAEQLDQLNNVDEYKAKLEAQLRTELEGKLRAELQAEQEKQQKKDAAILPSLTGVNSKGGLSSSDWSGPTSLDQILKGSPSH